MLKPAKFQGYLFLLLLYTVNISATEYIPDVYQDEYVSVRAGVIEVEQGPIHFGDALSLKIDVVFDDREVVIEDLGEEFFTRSWGSEKGITLLNTPIVTRQNLPDGQSLISGTFPFQILDCPGDLVSCAGHKIYELPIFTLGYQIVDTAGDVQNNMSTRFRPWPARVVVVPSLHIGHDGLEEFSSYFPGGGYPGALAIENRQSSDVWKIFAGGLVFLIGFVPVLFRNNQSVRIDKPGKAGSRWENALSLVQGNKTDLESHECADLMRRSITWYCLDELHINPYSWINDDSASADTDNDPGLKSLFFEILNCESMENNQREEYLRKFLALTGGNR